MAPRQTSVQLSKATERQVEELKQWGFGSFTDINRIAIDRMYREEVRKMKHRDLKTEAEGANFAAYSLIAGDPGVPEHDAASDLGEEEALKVLERGGSFEEAVEAARESYHRWE